MEISKFYIIFAEKLKTIMKLITEKFYNAFNKFLTEYGGMSVIFILAVLGIGCAIVGFHGTTEFNWKWFAFFEIPLYVFCGWALWKAFKMYKDFMDSNKK